MRRTHDLARGTAHRGHTVTAALGALVALGFALLLLGVGGGLPTTQTPYTVDALLPTAGTLAPGARVTMAGKQVGTVTQVARAGIGARVRLRFDDDAVTPLPRTSRVRLRYRTAVGENYVAVTPGSRRRATLRSGAVLPAGQAEEYVDVDQVLSTLQGAARAHVRELLQGSAFGLAGRDGELNAALGEASGLLVNGSRVTGMLDRHRVQVADLVDRLGRLSAALAQRGKAITQLARAGNATMRAVAHQDDALRATLHALPATLPQVRAMMGTLQRTSAGATPVVLDLARALNDLRPAVRRLRHAAGQGAAVLRGLEGAAPGLRATLRHLDSIDAPAAKALPAVRKTLCSVNPMLRYAAPYTKDVAYVAGDLGGASNVYDAVGHTVRVSLILNERSIAGLPDSVQDAANRLMHTGLLGRSTSSYWEPYPAPNQMGKATSHGKPLVRNPEEVARSGYRFPRIHADC